VTSRASSGLPQPQPIRLLFDELLPWRVAAALRILRHRVSYVGNPEDQQPARGSSDEEVLGHARRTRQVVVTSNHDMILLCIEQRQPAIWIDPRGRQFTRERLALLFLDQIPQWEAILTQSPDPVIVRALRTRVDTMTLDRARRIVMRRQRALRRKQRAKPGPKTAPLGQEVLGRGGAQ